MALCYDGPGSLRQTQGRAVLGCEGLWSQGEVGQAARVKPCGDGQGQGDSCHCSLGLKRPPWGSGDPGHWGQLVSKAPFRPSWAPSCVSGNQAWPLPWMPGPWGESPAQGPCRSCDFLRAGRLGSFSGCGVGCSLFEDPGRLPPKLPQTITPSLDFPWSLAVLEPMVGVYGPSWAQRSQPSSGRRDTDPWTLSVRDTPSPPQPFGPLAPCHPLLLTLPCPLGFCFYFSLSFCLKHTQPTLPPPPAGLHLLRPSLAGS